MERCLAGIAQGPGEIVELCEGLGPGVGAHAPGLRLAIDQAGHVVPARGVIGICRQRGDARFGLAAQHGIERRTGRQQLGGGKARQSPGQCYVGAHPGQAQGGDQRQLLGHTVGEEDGEDDQTGPELCGEGDDWVRTRIVALAIRAAAEVDQPRVPARALEHSGQAAGRQVLLTQIFDHKDGSGRPITSGHGPRLRKQSRGHPR